jgi:putative transposase
MSQYRRLLVPGGTYFFTVRLQDRRSSLLTQRIDLLRQAVSLARKRWPFTIDAAVILPDHLHMIWILPPGDADFSMRWRLIKATFSRHVPALASVRPSLMARAEKGIWQRRFWEHLCRSGADLDAHREYVFTAPVRAGLVARPSDWPFSSLHRELAKGDRADLVSGSGFGPV